MDLFTQYSPENYRTYLNEFIGSHGLEDYNNSDLDGTVFYNGGRDIRLVWEKDKQKLWRFFGKNKHAKEETEY